MLRLRARWGQERGSDLELTVLHGASRSPLGPCQACVESLGNVVLEDGWGGVGGGKQGMQALVEG